MLAYAKEAHTRGLKAIIACAGGAAHLPGMVAAATPLPVIGIPRALKELDGLDSLLSIVQMPSGVPVATVAGDELCAKVTVAHDLVLAELVLRSDDGPEASW